MSVATGNKGEKAKKFQSLNINNIYQGSALKPLQKNIPQKHGLQSLGKVPTARRAPANLPSLKAEHSGNDPTINLVPAGHGASGGWTATNSQKEDVGESAKPIKNDVSSNANSVPQSASGKVLNNSSAGGGGVPTAPSANSNNLQQPSISSKATWGSATTPQTGKASGPYLSQKSPLFGQEFPSLTGNTEVSTQNAGELSSPSPPPGGKTDSKYGPGPSLRPQSFATWSFSGKQASQSPSNSVEKDIPDKSSNHDGRNRNHPEGGGGGPSSLKFDVGVNSPLLQQGAPYLGRKSTPQRSQLVNKTSQPPQSSRPRDNLFQGSIIDSEKLKRMDDIDSNDDDWTRRDDSFDYNKRIDSDDDDDDNDDDPSLNDRNDSNWTEQINFSSSGRHSEPRDNFKPNSNSAFSRGGRGGGHRNEGGNNASHDHNHLSFLEDEDQRLSKKNEEVLKNIERARRRRAEEEQKYRVTDDPNQYNDTFPATTRRTNDRNNVPGNHYENGLLKSNSANSPFGRFDVGESDGYDSEKGYEGPATSTTTSSSRKPQQQQHQQQQSVPPRFKRHGVELHSYKRTSPPKERVSGDGDQSNDIRSSASRDSVESQPQESKDYGALFRQTSSSSSRGNRPPSGSSDLDSRFDPVHPDHHQSTAEEVSKKTKETDDENVPFPRGGGGRYSTKNNKGTVKSEEGLKHKGPSKGSDNSKDQKQHKRGEAKNDRNQRGGQRGGKDNGSSSASSKNHDRKQQNEAKGGNRRGASHRKEEDSEASSQQQQQPPRSVGRHAPHAEDDYQSQNQENNFEQVAGGEKEGFAGWFAPRGQPSRRGRGGISSNGINRASAKATETNEAEDAKAMPHEFNNRKSQPREMEWEETSSDPSEDVRNKDHRRRGGQGENKSNQRREKPKKQQGKKVSNDVTEDRRENDENEASQTARNRRGVGGGNASANSSRNQRQEEKDVRKGGPNAIDRSGDRRVVGERDTKQSSYERRQSKLPPRLAKQKEQNRLSGQTSAQEAWGMGSATDASGRIADSPHLSGGVAWDHSVPPASQQQFISCGGVQPNSLSGNTMVEFDSNQALLMQRFRNENAALANDGGNPSLRLNANIAMGGGGQKTSNLEEVFSSAESRDNAVQTIIFENTNFKGNRPINNSTGVSSNATAGGGNNSHAGNEKLMFKLTAGAGDPKAGLGYGGHPAKVDDDIKLDFSFETADMSTHNVEKGEPNASGNKGGAVRPPSSSSVVASSSAAQPATADDLNMKIASVKKVWETLPSMSPPVPGAASGNDQGTIGPFSSAPPSASDEQAFDASSARYDKDGSASANIAKVRPQQQPPQQTHPQAQPQHHLQSPPSQTQVTPSQQAHQSSQVQQQLHSHQASNQLHQATHQGLLQQASLDDRLMGRGNNANLTYNRLLGTGGLPNLQSPPSILGQQPSLYQAFQIDPNRAVTNQLYPYPPTGMGGQSLILPPSGSSLSAATSGSAPSAGDIFGSASSNQFGRQFAAPPPGSNQVSSAMNNVLMSQSSLMSSAMKPSVASAGIGPIGTKAAYQQGGLGSLAGSGTSPLLIPYDGGYVQNIQRSAAAGQTAFYQALAASSQQAAAAAASSSRHQQNNYGITGFPGQQSLVQQQLLRNHAPHQMSSHPYMKNDSNPSLKSGGVGQQLGGLQNRQFANAGSSAGGGSNGPSQGSIKSTATSLASMSLRNSVLGSGTNTNGAVVTSAATGPQADTSYSPTPIQRPPGGKGKAALESAEESSTVTLDVAASSKEKSDVED